MLVLKSAKAESGAGRRRTKASCWQRHQGDGPSGFFFVWSLRSPNRGEPRTDEPSSSQLKARLGADSILSAAKNPLLSLPLDGGCVRGRGRLRHSCLSEICAVDALA